MLTGFDTHEVTNQPPPLEGHDVFGALAGSAEAIEWGRQANRNPPELRTHDRYGNRLDVVDYHPAYQLMATAVANGLHAAPWAEERTGAHVARAAEVWEPRLTSLDYDPANRPAGEKSGATCGMAMTEKQGGSDVRASTTTATPADDGSYRLTGHKWFCSPPMSDLPRLFRQSPLNGVWEGSGNVICLDVLRAVGRAPETLAAYWTEVDDTELRARRLVEQMALLFQASQVLQHSPAAVADAFVASRLGDDPRLAFGTLPTGLALDEIVDRARPVPA